MKLSDHYSFKNTTQMHHQRLLMVFLLLFLTNLITQAQQKPGPSAPIKSTPIEFLLGHNRIQGQTTIVKNFGQSNFGIFSLLTLASDYKNADKSNNELFSNVQLNYDFYKGLKVTAGATFSSVKGFTPIAGLEYVFVNKNITFVVNPTLNLTKPAGIATFMLFEYAPKNDKLNAYGRFQGLYVQNLTADIHERSGVLVRLGACYRGFSSGLGINQDYYGPAKNAKSNIGLFLAYKFL